MQTGKQNKIVEEKEATHANVKWLIAALFTCITVSVWLLLSACFIKKELTANHSSNYSYSTGDVALLFAMPMLKVVFK